MATIHYSTGTWLPLKRLKNTHVLKVHMFKCHSISTINALRQVEQAEKSDGTVWIKLSVSVCSEGLWWSWNIPKYQEFLPPVI